VRILSEIIKNLTNNLKSGKLFPTIITITFRPESRTCARCGTRGKVLKTKTKPVATLAIGGFFAREFRYSCPRCGLVVGSEELRRLVPQRCNIGYDVLAYVGEAFFLGSRDNKQIVESLREKNVNICRSEVSYLAKKFIVYLALLHKKVQKETRAFLSMNGGYILHLDGTCDGDSPHLISVLDGITEIVLDNTKVLSENADDLIHFLKNIKAAYGDPVAVVSDMGKGILAAIREVFKNDTLLVWTLEGKNQGQGCGFPFDQPYLIFYQRLVIVYTLLGQFAQSGLFKIAKEKKLYSTIRRDLQPLIRDSVLKRASTKMLEKVHIFSRFRSAMRITLPENKRGLNDEGELCNMKTIEKEVTKFRLRLSKDKNRMKDKAYQKLIGQINKYWDMLFCDPIVVETKAGKIIIQPQRTNNILEQFFRALMRAYRKKNGFQAMARALKAMLKDTPLVMNLRNKDFMDILLGGKKSLAQRFSDVDAEIVRQQMKKSTRNEYPVSAKLKKIITAPTFPESLTPLIDKEAS